jgi:Protein of unknown function, DUF255
MNVACQPYFIAYSFTVILYVMLEAVQGMTGRGGWPLNVFVTPEQLPFYGGTYFPPDARHGMPAWTRWTCSGSAS